MENYSGKLDFLKLKNTCIISVNGETGSKKGVFIPIDDNNLFVSIDENNKAKSVYFDFMAYENKQPSKFGYTHMIKQSFNKDIRAKMTDEEKRALPIFGNMKPFKPQNANQPVETSVTPIAQDADDLPF